MAKHGNHSHSTGVKLTPNQTLIITNGLNKLLEMTADLDFKPLDTKKFALPLSNVPYQVVPSGSQVRSDIDDGISIDPVNTLEKALALFELYEVNQTETVRNVLSDMAFTAAAFSSKRLNGWIAVLGDSNEEELEQAILRRWKFRFFNKPNQQTGLYLLLNNLARYAFIYGETPFGDAHAVGHFVEDHAPGLLICLNGMDDLQLTLALMSMKMGVPAIVPSDFPFPFGKTLRVDSVSEIMEAVVAFPNIRRLIKHPDISGFPDYAVPENREEKFTPGAVWGDTLQSFFIVTKGPVAKSNVSVKGIPSDTVNSMGIMVTIDAEPMDAFDQRHIESRIANSVAMIKDTLVEYREGQLIVKLANIDSVQPKQIGEVLSASVRHNFPKITKVKVEISFDETELSSLKPVMDRAIINRANEISSTTEDTMLNFYSCVGCSQFAPNHVCILTPERPPQCGRAFELIKTGALYGYDDMSNIHHSAMYRDLNSFGVFEKDHCLDALRGEWSGANAQVTRLSQGRTNRILLHSLDAFPHTGCGCFGLIIFTMTEPMQGIGIMARGKEGSTPDGRSWDDLYYNQTGKQTSGSTGASAAYLRSPKFLLGHGGWKSIVWVSPKVAEILGSDLPHHVIVGNKEIRSRE